ncbi:heterokaryon incompatibility protein-domain-containing protein [Apiospora arundinis]
MPLYSKIHEWQTRLIVVKPNADQDARLEISLQVVDLVDVTTGAVVNHETIIMYDALSYTWGNEPPSIACTCDGTELLLRANLAAALKYLRYSNCDRYIWADFICINQQDDIEKSFQIPRMESIYSKASDVFIWLGETAAVNQILRRCNTTCRLSDAAPLSCPRHSKKLWEQVLKYPWFGRTWVRQEVYAARRLTVCFPRFTVPWEAFIQSAPGAGTSHETLASKASQRMWSLDEAFKDLRRPQTVELVRRLVDLLKQGVLFQATVPHDHIFSILGMMLMPKIGTRGIPVDYQKSYEEVCSDAVRFIIRETHSLDILKLCVFQKNKTYALDWPNISWSFQFVYERTQSHTLPSKSYSSTPKVVSLDLELFYQDSGPPVEWFDLENPIRDAGTSTPLESTNTILLPNQTIPFRPLVLQGRVWGTLTWSPRNNILSVYRVIHETDDEEAKVEHSPGHLSKVYGIFVTTRTKIVSFPDGTEREELEGGTFYGGRGGDVLVRLQPGAMDFILRKCPGIDDLFEIVGYSDSRVHQIEWTTSYENYSQPSPPGPDKRFRIR